jgi:hypothetical protein
MVGTTIQDTEGEEKKSGEKGEGTRNDFLDKRLLGQSVTEDKEEVIARNTEVNDFLLLGNPRLAHGRETGFLGRRGIVCRDFTNA